MLFFHFLDCKIYIPVGLLKHKRANITRLSNRTSFILTCRMPQSRSRIIIDPYLHVYPVTVPLLSEKILLWIHISFKVTQKKTRFAATLTDLLLLKFSFNKKTTREYFCNDSLVDVVSRSIMYWPVYIYMLLIVNVVFIEIDVTT